jgi:glutathione S-transferase
VSDAAMTLYHIPGCPFSERVEILMQLKGIEDAIVDHEIDISAPRPAWLLEKTGGVTSLPALDAPEGTLLESMVILRYLEDRFPERPVAQRDPFRHAIESWLAAVGGALPAAGYKMILNRDPAQRDALRKTVDEQFALLDAFLIRHGSQGPFLFDEFGWAEVAMTPMFKRLWFLEYYENYTLPAHLTRVKAWRDACLAHPATQGRSFDEIIKLYYDYAQGAGNGRLAEGRKVSSFALTPHWSERPWPPRAKWSQAATDQQLGLV